MIAWPRRPAVEDPKELSVYDVNAGAASKLRPVHSRRFSRLCLQLLPTGVQNPSPVSLNVGSTSKQSSVEWMLLLVLMFLIGLILYTSV
jgi:hypothetical protein